MMRKHVVIVQPYEKVLGPMGESTYRPTGAPVPVPCNVHPITADEITAFGLQEVDARKIVADTWPGDIHCRITYDGEEWDQHGPAHHHDISDNANSWQVLIQKR